MKVQLNRQIVEKALFSSKQVFTNCVNMSQPIIKETSEFFKKNKDMLKGVGVGSSTVVVASAIRQHIKDKKQIQKDAMIKKALVKQDAEIKEVKSDNERLNQNNELLQEALKNATGVNSDEKEE